VLLDRRLCQRVDVWTEIVRRTTVANEATDPTLSRTWALEQVNGSRFIVCEDVPGESVADELARLGPMPPLEACRTLLPVFTAVAELHRRGAVHGSLSLDGLRREPAPPGTGERGGRMRLLQFPLVGDPHLVPLRPLIEIPEQLNRLGTRASFVAPELAMPGTACDTRSDVYALGCILHALVSGRPPCWKGDARATLVEAATVGPAQLAPPTVPVEVATLIGYLTARDPAALPFQRIGPAPRPGQAAGAGAPRRAALVCSECARPPPPLHRTRRPAQRGPAAKMALYPLKSTLSRGVLDAWPVMQQS
jgi:serine/threonine-protein kinase